MSSMRRCDVFKATDGKWYLRLGRNEHDWDDDDCDVWGPFPTMTVADRYVDNFSNPGHCDVDASGTEEPPENPRKLRRVF